MATIFEQWIEQGMEIGHKQGKAEGIAEGIQTTLINLLQHRFGQLSAKHKAALAQLTSEQMQTVVVKALEVATLAEIMNIVAELTKQNRKQSRRRAR